MRVFNSNRISAVLLVTFFFGWLASATASTTHQFKVPPAMKKRVQFWTDIYAKYNSWEMLVHDVKRPNLIYEVIDNKDIKDMKVSERRKKYLIRKRYRNTKNKYMKILQDLHKKRDDISLGLARLNADEQKIVEMFSGIKDIEKFAKAAKRRSIRGQSGLRDKFSESIYFSGRYVPKIIEMLNEMGLPKEIAYLPFVESGFNKFALSKVGASGMWQIMPATGRYFLRVDDIVDERNDPLFAARAAAKLLKKNYEVLQEWSLAITAYNHGRAGMARAVRTVGSRDIATIIERYNGPAFGFASSNFYACFLAAVGVVQNRGKYFGRVDLSKPIEFDLFIVPDFVSMQTLSEYLEIKMDVLKELNPGIQKRVYEGERLVPVGYALRVPLTVRKTILANYAAIPDDLKFNDQLSDDDESDQRRKIVADDGPSYREIASSRKRRKARQKKR